MHKLFALFLVSALSYAYQPANRPYDIQNYRLNFETDPAQEVKELRIQTEITGKATGPLMKLVLDAVDLKVHSVKSFPIGRPLSFDISKPRLLTIQLEKNLKKGEKFHFVVDATAPVRSSHDGLFRVTDPDDANRGNLYFTMFEPEEARGVFPCNDEPYDKATTEVIARVPKDFTVISNGKKVSDRAVKKNAQWHEIHWQMQKPHSTYLVSFSIGKFSHLTQKEGKHEVSMWASSGKIDRAKYALETTRHSLRFFEKYLGTRYPWSKYATVGIPTYLWGGMENTSSTHMNQERTLLNDPKSAFEKKRITGLAAHELAHQWFGNYVTMKWWDDVWLNEAFASFMGTLAEKDQFKSEESEISFVTHLWDSYFREEDGPRSHPIVDTQFTSANDGFDSTNYTKGEAVLRTLRFYMGEDKFRKGLKLYLSKFALSTASNADFFKVMSEAAGEDLSSFRESWLLKRGYPVVIYDGRWGVNQYQFHISQRPNHAEDSHLFNFKIPVVFHRNSPPAYQTKMTIHMKEADKNIAVTLPAAPEWVNVNEGGVVLADVKMTAMNEDSLARQTLEDPDPFSRVWANYQLLAPLLKGEGISSSAERIILKSLMEDKSPYVRIATLQGIQRMKTPQVPDILGHGILELTRSALEETYESTPEFKKDSHGGSAWRSELVGTLGRVKQKEVLPILTQILTTSTSRLDDLDKAAKAIAMSGNENSLSLLKQAMEIHGGKGYKQRYVIFMAYGALANPQAANEIEKLAETATSDVMGKIGGVIDDNQTLKNSKEWASFIQMFVVKNGRFGDEVKARLLQTIEDVKTAPVQEALKNISEEAASNRLKDLAKKILTKNFSSSNL
jgi:aminopeptidase N